MNFIIRYIKKKPLYSLNVVQRKKSDIHISSTPNKNRDENPDPHTKYQLPNELGYVTFYISR